MSDPQSQSWREIRQIVLARDGNKCCDCGDVCSSPDTDVHHLLPRSMGGSDDLANLVTLCDGCHAAHHPNLQASLSRRFIEKWACRLARWLDGRKDIPENAEQLGGVLRLFGLTSFREGQLDVVLAALNGQSVLFVSPTGSGKTLCFQVPALLRSGVTCVVSPLKALMSDQIVRLQKAKIPGTFINSDLGKDEKSIRYDLIEKGAFKFVYCAPERFNDGVANAKEVENILAMRPSFLVIDEAHCIVRWGQDFRRSYGKLGEVRVKFGLPPALAFTATAGVKTQQAIITSLGLTNPRVVVVGVDRPNIGLLRLEVQSPAEKIAIINNLLQLMRHGKAMIFVPTRKVGELVKSELTAETGKVIPFFHSKIESQVEKDAILGGFTGRLSPSVDQVICTNAFGMGLDVPDVRLVIHWQPPDSAEAYLQEFGRAGRDGKPSLAVVLYDSSTRSRDKGLLQFMAEMSTKTAELPESEAEAVLNAKLELITAMYQMARPGRGCFRRHLTEYFCGLVDKRRKGLMVWLLEWVFSARVRRPQMPFCCDACNRINTINYMDTARRVLS